MGKPRTAEPAPRHAVHPEQAAEELRLWADYYEATTRVLELVRSGDMTSDTFSLILAGHARAAAVLDRIKAIRASTH